MRVLAYAGVAIILVGVFAHPLLVRRPPHRADPMPLGTAESKTVD